MPETHTLPSPTHPARMKLEPYSAEIRLPNLTLGIDNIHYDVFLSPRFVEFTRKYLLDLIRQTVNISLVYGKDQETAGPRTRRVSQAADRNSAGIADRGQNTSSRSKPTFCTSWRS